MSIDCKIWRHVFLPLVVMVSVALAISACGGTNGGGEGDEATLDEGKTIGVAMKTQVQRRWEFDERAMRAKAKELGDKLIVQYANDDPGQQANQVENLLTQGIDALIIVPVDDKAAGALVQKAKNQQVPVVAYDIAVLDAPVDFFVTRDNYKVGELQANAAKRMHPSGKYALIKGDPANNVAREIGEAYAEIIENDDQINIVYNQFTKNWDPNTALSVAENVLSAQNDDVQAFVTSNDGMATGVSQALKSRNLGGKVFLSGLDADPANLQLIASGVQTMTVWTKIDQQGRVAAQAAHDLANGQKPVSDTEIDNGYEDIPAKLVDVVEVNKENLCNFITETSPEGWVSVEKVFKDSEACAS